jgi:hypothetical protein
MFVTYEYILYDISQEMNSIFPDNVLKCLLTGDHKENSNRQEWKKRRLFSQHEKTGNISIMF